MLRKHRFFRIYSIALLCVFVSTLALGDISLAFAKDAPIPARITDDITSKPGRISDTGAPAPLAQPASKPAAGSSSASAPSSASATSETLVDKAVKTVTDPKFIGGTVIGGNAGGLAGDVAGKGIVKGVSRGLESVAAKAATKAATRGAGKVLGKIAGYASYAVPGVGPVLGAFTSEVFGNVGEAVVGSAAEDIAAKKDISFKKAVASIDWSMVAVKSIGGVIGSIGLTMLCPPLGIAAVIGGSIIGSTIAEFAFKGIRKLIENHKKNKAARAAGQTASATGGEATSVAQQAASAQSTPFVAGKSDSGLAPMSMANETGACDAKYVYEKMNAHYANYVKLVAAGQGDSAEAKSALSEYERLSVEYAKLGGQPATK